MVKRGVGRPKISFDQTPEFFQVYLPDHNSLRLRIPPDFIKHFNGTIPDKAILKDLGGKLWHVNVEEDRGGFFLANGWQDFAKANSIEIGEFLVLRYNGNSLFTVRIFGKNGCKKEEEALAIETTATHVKIEAESDAEQTCRNRSIICKRSYSRGLEGHEKKSRGYKKSSTQTIIQRSSFSRAAVVIEKDTALKAANKFMSTSKHPSFKIVMKPYFIKSGYWDIPAHFVKANIKEDTKIVELQISNKSWLVNLTPQRNRLSGGLCAWARENSLQVGDVCLLELINRDDVVLKVSIFRCTN